MYRIDLHRIYNHGACAAGADAIGHTLRNQTISGDDRGKKHYREMERQVFRTNKQNNNMWGEIVPIDIVVDISVMILRNEDSNWFLLFCLKIQYNSASGNGIISTLCASCEVIDKTI